MANPQKENGYTPIANELLEHLYKWYLSPNQWQVILCIARKTYGYSKKSDYITSSQIVVETGLCKSVVSRALDALTEANIIIRNGKNIGIQKDWEQWKKLAKRLTKVSHMANNKPEKKLAKQLTEVSQTVWEVSQTVNKSLPFGEPHKQKETYTKETIQKQYIVPEGVDENVFNAFLEMRKKIKEPPTDYAIKLIFKELEKLKALGNNPNEVLNQSIMNNWKGVFALKNNGGKACGSTQNNSRAIPTKYETHRPVFRQTTQKPAAGETDIKVMKQ